MHYCKSLWYCFLVSLPYLPSQRSSSIIIPIRVNAVSSQFQTMSTIIGSNHHFIFYISSKENIILIHFRQVSTQKLIFIQTWSDFRDFLPRIPKLRSQSSQWSSWWSHPAHHSSSPSLHHVPTTNQSERAILLFDQSEARRPEMIQ